MSPSDRDAAFVFPWRVIFEAMADLEAAAWWAYVRAGSLGV